MKHSDWLRLYNEGESLCSILRQRGYQCRKEAHRLSPFAHLDDPVAK